MLTWRVIAAMGDCLGQIKASSGLEDISYAKVGDSLRQQDSAVCFLVSPSSAAGIVSFPGRIHSCQRLITTCGRADVRVRSVIVKSPSPQRQQQG
jgi:hypothetical protein